MAIAADSDRRRYNGQSLSSGGLARTYGFDDLDGSRPDCWRYLVEVEEAGKPADATGYRGGDYDLIAFFDCLHDMADPAGAAAHARLSLKPDGHCLLVEPFAGDSLADNLNPVSRVFYGASSLICVPVSLAQQGPALGAQAGERRLAEVMVDDGGFSLFRRVAETPFNLVFEARP